MLLSHFLRWPGGNESNLFYLTKANGLIPVKYKDLLDFMKKLVSFIGLDPKDFGLHSLRRAAATFYHQIGLSLSDIMILGDWRSLSVFEYIMLPEQRKSSIETYVSYRLANM